MTEKGAAEARDRAVAQLARKQHGVVSRDQLVALGIGKDGVAAAVQRGRLIRVHPRVYAVGHASLQPRARRLAAVLSVPGAVLGYGSAAALWGLRPYSGVPELVVVGDGGRRRRGDLIVHRARRLDVADRAVVDGIPATSWPRAMLDCASVVRDGYGKMITRAEQSDLFDMNALVAAMERAPHHRGAARIRRALAELHPASSWSKSDLEDAMLRLCQRLDLAGPVCNAMVEGFEVDFLWLEHRLVAEADGWGFHKTRSAFQRDRTRDRALQLAGYRVLRFTYADVEYRPELVAVDLRRALR